VSHLIFKTESWPNHATSDHWNTNNQNYPIFYLFS